MRWDPQVYERFQDERSRPFFDLVSVIAAGGPDGGPRRVVDLGCGPGELTASLAGRWPGAHILGIDSSPEMIASAEALPAAAQPEGAGRLSFARQSIEEWSPAGDEDVVVSNAALQWVPSHRELIAAWLPRLAPGAWFAFQVPGNFEAPSHALMRRLADSPEWSAKLAGILRVGDSVGEAPEYLALLADAGYRTTAWETTYLHVLQGEDPVLNWVRGTGLRPLLAALDADDAARFESQYAALLREAYPATPHGTVFPFRRIFTAGQKLP